MDTELLSELMEYELGGLDAERVAELFQRLVDTGIINHLQGSYQRTAVALRDAGLIS